MFSTSCLFKNISKNLRETTRPEFSFSKVTSCSVSTLLKIDSFTGVSKSEILIVTISRSMSFHMAIVTLNCTARSIFVPDQ